MMYPLVLDLAAEGIPVRLTCGVLGFSPQAFYKWRANPCSDRDLDDAYLTNALIDAHAGDPEFGYRFLADELDKSGSRSGSGGCGDCVGISSCGRPRPAKAVAARSQARRSTTIS